MEEYQIWTLFQNARIANGLTLIATVLIIWLSLRTAMQTRTPVSGEAPNIVTKALSTAFCLLNVFFVYGMWTVMSNARPLTARAFSQLQASGAEISDTAQGFISYVGSTEPTGIGPLAYVFLAVITAMMMGMIWAPKQPSE
ncbi:MAG: hypothetical protein ACPGGG_01985 [Parvibaculales bacterium]